MKEWPKPVPGQRAVGFSLRGSARVKTRGSLRRPALNVVLLLGPATLIGLWLAFQHKPGWYQPAVLDDADMQRSRSQAVETVDYVSDQMVEGKPFEIVLDDRSVNEWLTALPHVWPDAQDVLPPQLTSPAVHFDDGRILAAAHYADNGWRAIVSVVVSLAVSEDGTVVDARLAGAHGGSLPVPRVILDRLLQRLLESTRSVQVDPGTTAERLVSALGKVRSVDEMFEGVSLRNRFIWFNGERPFKIQSFSFGDGELRLRIKPL